MCGIAGIFDPSKKLLSDSSIARMNGKQLHRGPDGQGIYIDSIIGFGHTRLAITSTAELGIQPMLDDDSKNVLTFNGEIYNYESLRNELEKIGIQFKTGSDTEVLLKGLGHFGSDFVQQLEGDFAFAFWNSKKQQLLLCRDRLGVKPLYYIERNKTIFFASEIKSLLEFSNKEISKLAIENIFAFRYTRGEGSIWTDIKKLLPGHLLQIDLDHGLRIKRYWSPENRPAPGLTPKKLLGKLESSIAARIDSDLKIGIFLSGGIDSSLIAQLASSKLACAYTCETPGGSDDTKYAVELARSLGIKSKTITDQSGWIQNLGRILSYLDEPIADSIIFPTFRLCEEARKDVSIALSGEGADEVFTSYGHQNALRFLLSLRSLFGFRLLGFLANFLSYFPSNLFFVPFFYPISREKTLKARAISLLQNSRDIVVSYHTITALWSEKERSQLLRNSIGDAPLVKQSKAYLDVSGADRRTDMEKIRALDLGFWLPDYGLRRLDSLSMAHGLEVRVPYLAHDVVELILSNENSILDRNKNLIRKAAQNFPALALTRHRKKHPFLFPLNEELLKSFLLDAREVLQAERVARYGILNEHFVSNWVSLFEPSFLNSKKLFSLVIFQLWCESNLEYNKP